MASEGEDAGVAVDSNAVSDVATSFQHLSTTGEENGLPVSPDVLFLSEGDVLTDKHKNFLTPITVQKFESCYEKRPPVIDLCAAVNGEANQRVVIVLPFFLSDVSKVIPIPFILYTGSSHYMHLAQSAIDKLNDYECIKKAESTQPSDAYIYDAYILDGNLCRTTNINECRKIENPRAYHLEDRFENSNEELHTNILGWPGIKALELLLFN